MHLNSYLISFQAQGRDYQWFFQFGDTDSGWLPIGHIKNAEPVGNTLRFIDLTQRNSGSYKCITTVESEGRYLEVEATAHLEVLSEDLTLISILIFSSNHYYNIIKYYYLLIIFIIIIINNNLFTYLL